MNDWKEAAESSDAAVQNMRAGNHALAQTHAVVAIMHLLSAMSKPAEFTFNVEAVGKRNAAQIAEAAAEAFHWPLRKPTVNSNPLPTEPGIYQDRHGLPWWRTAVESDAPWMSITHGHCDDRWFTDEHAAQHAPFTRMEAVQR